VAIQLNFTQLPIARPAKLDLKRQSASQQSAG